MRLGRSILLLILCTPTLELILCQAPVNRRLLKTNK